MKSSITQTIHALLVLLMYTISCSAPAQSPQAGVQETRRKSVAPDQPFCPADEVDSRFCAEGTPDGRASNCTSLMMAAESGQLDRVRSLLASRAEVDTRAPQSITALGLAAGAGHLEVVKVLLAAGANPNIVGGSFHGGPFAIWMAALNRCNKDWLEIFQAMLDGRGRDQSQYRYLHVPARGRHSQR